MDPQIRYTRASDGVTIAFWTLGAGPPLVYLPPMPQHVQLDWKYPPARELYEWLSRRNQLVRFDFRGRGLSQRGEIETTPATELLDLEAVIAKLDLESIVIVGHGTNVNAAVRYAARHGEQVRQLVLVDPFPPLPEIYSLPQVRAVQALLQADHLTYTEVVAYMIWGWQGGERTRHLATLLRASLTHEQAVRDQAGRGREASEDFIRCLPRITAPTLLVHHSEAVFATADSVQRLTSEIPDARLVLLEGEAVGGSFTDPMMMAAVDEFLGGGGEGAPTQLPAGTAVILFLDIAGSTALTERMGDSAFRASSRALDGRLRVAINDAGGTAVEGKVMGDGVMAVFTSAAQAIDAALRCFALSADSELALHIGLHAGDVIREKDNVYGGAVNIASRICEASTPGEILVSATVRDLARTSAGVAFEDRGERTLKGMDDPMRVFAVLPVEARPG